MNILLDTHAFLWLRTAPDKITSKVLAAYYDMENDVFLSMASVWEMQIKWQLGKLELEIPLGKLIDDQCVNNGLQILPIETHHVYALADLPFHHKDPFDRLILTQSKLENLLLSSADTIFFQYDVNLFW
ncbi:MAG: type II toxin-antitoxin system VapC family toxin [Proteobacteria bacterium]|nr:type II toxin-antitoxin system VapC family toxin [Pseudomonadota bacterium]